MMNQMKRSALLALSFVMMLSLPTYGQSFLISTAGEDDVDLSYMRGIMDLVQDYYVEEVDMADLVEGAYQGIFEALDRHSVYLPPAEYEEFSSSLDGDFNGIGVHITKDGDYLGVIAPIEGTPAYDAGMMPGDIIIKVDGEDIAGWSMEKAITQIRGEAGTLVVITVMRPGSAAEIDFPIVRESINIDHVTYEMLDEGIGYMEIESFADDVGEEVGQGIAEFEKAGAKGMILDLRGNPGGSLQEAIEVSEYFLEKDQPIVFIDYRAEEDIEYKAEKGKINMPLVVLIDEGSASASEIVTSAVQDNKAGTVIGTTSYGKGTVQTIVPLSNGAAIKITIAQYFSANRNKINEIGITPDIMIENVASDADYSDFAPMIEGGVFKIGSKGLDVYGAQQRLNFLGYRLGADGLFGEKMEKALMAFQENEDLEVNGYLDLKTKQRIKERVRDYIIIGEKDFQLEEAKEIILETSKK